MIPRKPWLPRGFEFLSGLPEARRRRRLLMIIQAFVDESESHHDSPVFVMAGLISYAENWASFSDEWGACLDAHPSIKYFKLLEAAKLSDQFSNFDDEMRDKKMKDLAHIINKHVAFSVFSGIDKTAFKATHKGVKKPFNKVDFVAFHSMILGFSFDLYEQGLREPFQIIFDRRDWSEKKLKSFYPTARKNICKEFPHLDTVLPIDPRFDNDLDVVPLQAADLFAGCYMRNFSRPKKDLFHWLIAEMPNVKASNYSSFYDLENLKQVRVRGDKSGQY